MAKGEASVLVERRDALTIITLNRPERRNGLTVAMCAAIHEVLSEIAKSDARVVILRGAGSDFCVGADIGGKTGEDPPPGLAELGQLHHAASLLHAMPQITIAAIDGGCAGAGLGYAAACDFRFATPQARFSTAFLNVGVSGDMGLAWSLMRIVGPARARELLFFPEKFDGARALELGLVTRLFPRQSLHAEVVALAGQLCGRDPLALRLMKANCLSAERLDMREFVEVETARHLHCTNRPEMAASLAAGLRQAKGE